MPTPRNTLKKEERLHGRKAIEELFKKAGSRSMVIFPLRVVYALIPKMNDSDIKARMLVSVPKRCFKRAVKRNRVKRQVREAFRKNKHSLIEAMERLPEKDISIAFVWLDNSLHESDEVEKKIIKLLYRVEEKVAKHASNAQNASEGVQEL